MSLQIAILKVLISYPDGRATVAALNSDLAILNTSGSDWTSRLRRLAARAPDLDIFSQGFVVRAESGWQITTQGRVFLDLLETGASLTNATTPSGRPLPSPEPVPLLLS